MDERDHPSFSIQANAMFSDDAFYITIDCSKR